MHMQAKHAVQGNQVLVPLSVSPQTAPRNRDSFRIYIRYITQAWRVLASYLALFISHDGTICLMQTFR